MEWGIAVGAITCLLAVLISYAKGVSDGLEKNDEDIENMLDEAIKRAKEMK